ncbi:CopG family transcriptional regulator [Azotobacter chroococcum subsp. isscasi]|uniref:ribbon-helix-helix domain-containing protein n=1 Tax=Azotobacter chroococcum TaxID=353 RepID=UPI00103F861E|nr:CopG family transcriptional regulator [Azotobacter chroococcum]TBW12376.1 CopG family transcriptional regulator [Azotobacter chroococcum subsp. isscasi]
MKSARTTISLPPEQLEQLQALADRHGLSLAWVIRQAINEFLARIDQPAGFDPLASRKEG